MKITLNDIKYMVNESVRRIIKEGKPIIRHFDDGYEDWDGDEWDDDEEENREEEERQSIIDEMDYDAYVLVDESDGAILANYAKGKTDPTYDPYEDAINDANQKKAENKFGTYCVYGCIEDAYDDDTLVYSTDEG